MTLPTIVAASTLFGDDPFLAWSIACGIMATALIVSLSFNQRFVEEKKLLNRDIELLDQNIRKRDRQIDEHKKVSNSLRIELLNLRDALQVIKNQANGTLQSGAVDVQPSDV